MAATREQLMARWEAEPGGTLIQSVCQKLEQLDASIETLQQLLSRLPFIEEVAPHMDFRGLHLPQASRTSNEYIFIKKKNLSGARFDYLTDIGNIVDCQMQKTIFDEMFCINGIFSSDFSEASFVRATLKGVRLWNSNLSEANFRQARLGKADLSEVSCHRATFLEADLRFSKCPGADFRGADLSGADLSGADLRGIQFDDQTRLQGANLRSASMSTEFRAFARSAGAIVTEPAEHMQVYDLACLDALIALMQEQAYNQDGHLDRLIPYVVAQREKLAEDPYYYWDEELGKELRKVTSEEMVKEVFDVLYPEAMRLLAYYL
ncbi:MAG TPA: pentapeptide repeat-containing protein [Ktedonosporobacter sp.]|jgi:uncharacterized protein YjbI with pentapeptide repeats|nr:pentapeptide repeat-containing protein [Ktedonosporobacter sp.]